MRYDPKKIEQKWQKKWLAAKIYEPNLKRAKRPFYNLMMFPYPSAEGLHIGGMRTFTGVDIYGRLKRMQGHEVFEPIGLDAFGIHSENYALKTGRHPLAWSKIAEKNYYRQLAMMGNGFAWDERLETNDPEYYRWTQWIFVAMFKRGLAYRKKQAVNWCLSCKTVLADEQVIAGKCERCVSVVIKKELEQWFFRITRYAELLLNNLDTLDWSERVKIAQRNWIGKSEGALIKFQVSGFKFQEEIAVFTTRPDTLFGATFLAVSPELAKKWMDAGWQASDAVQKFVSRTLASRAAAGDAREEKEKEGVYAEITAINPANQEHVPVWVVNYVLGDVGTGAIMAVPAHDERDFEFAKKYNLPIKIVVCRDLETEFPRGNSVSKSDTPPVLDRAHEGEGHLVASGKFDGMRSQDARCAITDFVSGKRVTHYHLRDWLISRQRYWGPPIPMIFCDACAAAGNGERDDMPGWYATPEKSLPVKLPFLKNFRPTGTEQSPLATVEKFYKVRCPACKRWARRETDVSDTFLDSAWYFLRYPSAKNKKAAWDPAITKKWLPVDMYIGGAEHSVLHLLYARFLTMAMHDAGHLSFEEPFTRFRAHGLIIKDGAKMSKSKGNVVSPDDYVSAYGADAVRMYLAFLAPFEQGGDFRDAGIKGMTRFLERVWKIGNWKSETGGRRSDQIQKKEIQRLIHWTIKKVTGDIESLRYNTAISALMALLNTFEEQPDAVSREEAKTFLKLLAPFAPHLAEELWQKMKDPESRIRRRVFASIHEERWPRYDARLIRQETFELVIQVNGKVRGRLTLPAGTGEQDAARAARGAPGVASHLSGEPKKIIFVPNKLINFVTG